jgi:hypothetical protein
VDTSKSTKPMSAVLKPICTHERSESVRSSLEAIHSAAARITNQAGSAPARSER